MSKGINVLSLFNGMSTGHLALENVGIKVNKYYSSELKAYAIELTQHHYPYTIQLGNVLNWKDWDIEWSKIDLVLSGSPCKDLSIAGKRKGINGSNSGLFWEFVDILNHIKELNPKVIFLQENVGSAPKKDIGIMSRAMGCYPVRINSQLLTAQLRDRYYWTNCNLKKVGMFDEIYTDIPQPNDLKIMLCDVITDGCVDLKKARALLMSEAKTFAYKDWSKFSNLIESSIQKNKQIPNFVFVDRDKARAILESESRPLIKKNKLYERYKNTGMNTIVFEVSDEITVRPLNKIELCRLQGFPDDYCDILTRNKAASLLGDGWTLPVIEHIFNYLPFKKI